MSKSTKRKKPASILSRIIAKRKILTLILVLAVGSVGLLKFVNSVNAQTVNAGPLQVSYPGSDPIFSQTNYKPGDTTTKTLTITNNGSVDHSFALATDKVTGDLSSQLFIKAIYNGSEVWSKTVADLALPGGITTIVPIIHPEQTVTVDLIAQFDPAAGNNYQDKSVKFDIVFGDQEAEPEETATATETSTTTTTVTSTVTSTSTSTSSPTTPSGTTGTPTSSPTGGVTTTLGGIARFFAGVPPVVTTSASPTATASPTVFATATAGEVKGAQTGNVKGFFDKLFHDDKLWWLLLITPIVAAIVLMFPNAGITVGIIVPIAGALVAAILSYFFPGDLKAYIFWIILGLEVVIAVVMNYFLLKKDEEESELEEKKKN